jgi:hypothetical protein
MRRRSVITVGAGDAEVKIYTLHRKDGYPSFQCAWYDLGNRKTNTFAKLEAPKLRRFLTPRRSRSRWVTHPRSSFDTTASW